jgi:hypothetical protein
MQIGQHIDLCLLQSASIPAKSYKVVCMQTIFPVVAAVVTKSCWAPCTSSAASAGNSTSAQLSYLDKMHMLLPLVKSLGNTEQPPVVQGMAELGMLLLALGYPAAPLLKARSLPPTCQVEYKPAKVSKRKSHRQATSNETHIMTRGLLPSDNGPEEFR